ncbi:MAG: GTP 3',8-cyclase MoaA [Smithellaceae bacterium]|nr:GTP 3',8-cyclase MoaA [Smithellaceae bacterium]
MIDRYNRDINYLRVSVTDRCNLRCQYCMPKEGVSSVGHHDILRYEEIERIVAIATHIGITKVRITGGEPLVRRGIVDFIRGIGDIEGISDISLTTNGILLSSYAEALHNAGIRRINVSLDSLNAEKYREITRGGELNTVLRGIEEVYSLGFSPIKINVVAIKDFNDDEILDFASLTIDRPYEVRFIELMPLGKASTLNLGRHLSNKIVLERIGAAHRLETLNGKRNVTDGPARRYRIEGAAGEIGFISPVSSHFCQSCNRLRLTADGHLRSCLLLDEEIDLRGHLRSGCSDADLEQLILSAIANKPMGHDVNCDEVHVKKCVKDMSSIGG